VLFVWAFCALVQVSCKALTGPVRALQVGLNLSYFEFKTASEKA
jgi:hypothetical protein